jgi:hypothetical protein
MKAEAAGGNVLEQNRLHRAAAERDRHGTLSDSCSWFLGWSSDLLRPVITGCRILQATLD